MSRECLGGGRGGPRPGIQHLQLCLPGQRLPTFPTGDELCIATEGGTGAALHGDGTRCPSRRPAELKEESRNIYFGNISAQPRKEGTVRLDAVSVGSNILIVGRCTPDRVGGVIKSGLRLLFCTTAGHRTSSMPLFS